MYDVEILGAGPAGSYAANALARKGYSVHLVDRATFPRDKLCGGGLTRKSLNLIEELEPSFTSAGLSEFVHDLYLFSPDGEEYLSAQLPGDSLSLVHRRSFDAWWLGRAMDAGAEFSPTPAGARFTVAADGASSDLGESIRGPFRGDEIAVATEAVSPTVHRPFVAIALPGVEAPSSWGYSWLFGRSDGVAIGSGVRRDQGALLPTLREGVCAVASRFGIRERPHFTNWVIPLYRPRPAARGNVALVGDALGTADPLFVEGIASGMTSARILVQSLDQHQDFSHYTADLAHHPYFRSMTYLELLSRIAGSDPGAIFRVAQTSRLLEQLAGLLLDPSGARSLVRSFALRHPLKAERAWESPRVPPRWPAPVARSAAA